MSKQTLHLQNLQSSVLQEIGLKLAQTREQREFSLEDLAVKTHIPVRLLDAIESGDLTQLPEPVYVQSFIRQYANSLGLNGVQIASEFPTQPIVRSPQKVFGLKRPALQLRPVHFYGVYALMIIGAVQGLSMVLNPSVRQVPALPNAQRSQPRRSPQKPPRIAVGPAPVAKPQAVAQAKPVRVRLTLTDTSWVRFVVDGKEKYEGNMQAGEKRLLMAEQKVTVVAGNAGGVIATFNGGEAKPLGAPGAVQEVSFPPESNGVAGTEKSWVASNNK